ncbi:MAG: DUF3656 domain-containing protein [Lachnospiraceae bacterium]|nr:DUF3656 domain-containing protein [Lachnospiraceae bacterium]
MRRLSACTGEVYFESLEISLSEGLFLPVRMLNELRREALGKLRDRILIQRGSRTKESLLSYNEPDSRYSEILPGESDESGDCPVRDSVRPALNLLVTMPAQLDAVLSWLKEEKDSDAARRIHTVYLDSMLLGDAIQSGENCGRLLNQIEELHTYGLRCMFGCPPVLRESGRAVLEHPSIQTLLHRMDGFLIQTVDELAYLKTYAFSWEFVSEDCLYSFNRESKKLLRSEGITRFTLPAELNSRELSHMELTDCELVVYGYQALMQSAQCVRKNTAGCSGRSGLLYLRDRKGIHFPVLNRCLFCTNTLYNSVPLRLGCCGEEVRKLGTPFLRLSFTIETGAQTKQILRLYAENRFDTSGTRGHFKRGVE